MFKEFYTISEIAEVTHIDKRIIYALRDYELLKMTKIGSRWGTTGTELERFLNWALGKRMANREEVAVLALKEAVYRKDTPPNMKG